MCTRWRLHLWFSRWYLVNALPALSAKFLPLPSFGIGRHWRVFFVGMNFILDAHLFQTATSCRVINLYQQKQKPKQSALYFLFRLKMYVFLLLRCLNVGLPVRFIWAAFETRGNLGFLVTHISEEEGGWISQHFKFCMRESMTWKCHLCFHLES